MCWVGRRSVQGRDVLAVEEMTWALCPDMSFGERLGNWRWFRRTSNEEHMTRADMWFQGESLRRDTKAERAQTGRKPYATHTHTHTTQTHTHNPDTHTHNHTHAHT